MENGNIARKELLKEDCKYDMVLLDLKMPEMVMYQCVINKILLTDGLELLCFMKENDKMKDIPVIMMSLDDELDAVAICMSKGAKDYLMKPIRIAV